MKNKTITFLVVMTLSVATLFSCSNSNKTNPNLMDKTGQNKEASTTTDSSNSENIQNENKDSKTSNDNESATTEKESKIQFYLDKYSSLEKDLETSLKSKKNGKTLEMREASSTEYTSWDSLLNEIYGVLQGQLPTDKFEELKTEQIAWINTRDSKAKEESMKFEGGTMEPLAHTSSLAQTTKERCYELINNYMK